MTNGFERSSADSICTDIKECLQQSSAGIGPYDSCQNEIGSFRCDCMANGFRRPPVDPNCTDIDECSENKTHALGHTNLVRMK